MSHQFNINEPCVICHIHIYCCLHLLVSARPKCLQFIEILKSKYQTPIFISMMGETLSNQVVEDRMTG